MWKKKDKTTKILKSNWLSQRNAKSVLYVKRSNLLRIYLPIGVLARGGGGGGRAVAHHHKFWATQIF